MNDKDCGYSSEVELQFSKLTVVGSIPTARSKICEALNIVFAIGFLLWMPLTIGLVLSIYNAFIN